MSQHRYRQNKVKREHSIIEGLLPVLERIASLPGVQSVTPGRISPRSRPGPPGIRFQYLTETGLKLLARSIAAVQEVFVVTDAPERVVEQLRAEGIVRAKQDPSEGGEPRARRPLEKPGSGKTQSSPKGRTRKRRRRERGEREPEDKEAAQPEEARPPQSTAGTPNDVDAWSEILERHEQLLELEQRLSDTLLGRP